MDTPKPTDDQIFTAISDALGAIAVATALQLDTDRFVADLHTMAKELDGKEGRGTSAGLVDKIAKHVARSLEFAHGH